MNRRAFLKGPAVAIFGTGAAPQWLARAATARAGGQRKVLVTIFQRGAVDGLNVIVPHGDPEYYSLRPGIAVPKTDVLELDGFFGLHPALSPMRAIFEDRKLAIVHAAGSPDPTRSHFDAQDYMESGTPGLKATQDGWLNRALTGDSGSPVRAVAMGPVLPRTLRGRNAAVAIAGVPGFRLRDQQTATTFEQLYGADQKLSGAAKDTFEAMKLLRSLPAAATRDGVSYPGNPLGRNLQQIAQLIKADVGLEVAFCDVGGWDTHVNEVPQLQNLLTGFGAALSAFYQDLQDRMSDVAVVTMSEFGRTARENGNRGTDHGHANVMLAFGGPIAGGKIYGKWPGLAAEQLYEGRDLAVTTDFRDVLGELVAGHLGVPASAQVFPGHRVSPPGLLVKNG